MAIVLHLVAAGGATADLTVQIPPVTFRATPAKASGSFPLPTVTARITVIIPGPPTASGRMNVPTITHV